MKRKLLLLLFALVLAFALCACGGEGGGETTKAPETTKSAETTDAPTQPTETEPTVTEPMVTEPTATEPVVTEPAVTEPVTTQTPEVDMRGISFTDQTVFYDGSAKSIEISGTLPEGVEVSYVGNGQILPGTYEITASFTAPEGYAPIADMKATLTINKAIADMRGVLFEDATVAYDGEYHRIVIQGILPEGVEVTYSGKMRCNVGEYVFTAKFSGENYEEIPNMKATLTITAPTVQEGHFTYVDAEKTFLYSVNPGYARQSLIIPDGVTRLADYALYSMKMVRKIYIPASVTQIGEYALGYYDDYYEGEMLQEDTCVFGAAGSAAEEYCTENEIAFRAERPVLTFAKASDLYVAKGLVAQFETAEAAASTVDLANGKWYALGNNSVYATLRGGYAWWLWREDGGIGYDMTQSQLNNNGTSVGIGLPISLLNEDAYTVEATLIAFGAYDASSPDGRSYTTGGWGNYNPSISAFSFGCIRSLQFGGHDQHTIFETRWFYHPETWSAHSSDASGIATNGALSVDPVRKTLSVTYNREAAETFKAVCYVNGIMNWEFHNRNSAGIYKDTYYSVAEGAFELLSGYPGTVYSVRVYNRALSTDEIAQNHLARLFEIHDLDPALLGEVFAEELADIAKAMRAVPLDAEKSEVLAALLAAKETDTIYSVRVEYLYESGGEIAVETRLAKKGEKYWFASPVPEGYYTRDLYVCGEITDADVYITVEMCKIPSITDDDVVRSLVPGAVCWGDSITAGAGGGDLAFAKANGLDLVALGNNAGGGGWVTVLNNLMKNRTGSLHGATNCGVGGETSAVIAARAMTETYYLYVGKEMVVPKSGAVTMDIQQYSTGGRLGILRQGEGNSINDVSIEGVDENGEKVTIKGKISISVAAGENKSTCDYDKITYSFLRNADSISGSVTIPVGAKIVTHGSHAYDGQWCILFIGTNGGWENVEELIRQQEEMLAAANCGDKYVIVGLSNGSAASRASLESAMKERWGDHYFSAREAVSDITAYQLAGISEDVIKDYQESIDSGIISSAFLADSVHMNAVGYSVLGNAVMMQLWSLGFFDPLFDYYESVR